MRHNLYNKKDAYSITDKSMCDRPKTTDCRPRHVSHNFGSSKFITDGNGEIRAMYVTSDKFERSIANSEASAVLWPRHNPESGNFLNIIQPENR